MKRETAINLGLLSAYCIMLLVTRMLFTQSISYIFLGFNLLLAWIPLWIISGIETANSKAKLTVMLCGWLLFFPNAPYLITDLVHLKSRNDFPLWYDAIMLFSFAYTGMLTGIYSLLLVFENLKKVISKHASVAVVVLLTFLSGYGVYMGRFLRWNSWDILFNPQQIVFDFAHRIMYPTLHFRTYGVTLLLGTLLLFSFRLFESLTKKDEL